MIERANLGPFNKYKSLRRGGKRKTRKKSTKKQIGSGAQCSRPGLCINDEFIEQSKHGNIREMEMLLDRGADVNARDEDGKTALHHANFYYRSPLILSMLLDRGADVNAKDENGWTPLIWASYWGTTYQVEMLLENGADVNAKNEDGMTALHWASYWVKTETVELLLKNRADVNAINSNGVNAADFAETSTDPEKAQVIKKIRQHVTAKTIPEHLKTQKERKKDWDNLRMVMTKKEIDPDTIRNATKFLGGGKRKSRKNSTKKCKKSRKSRKRRCNYFF